MTVYRSFKQKPTAENCGFLGSNLAAVAASLRSPRMSNDEVKTAPQFYHLIPGLGFLRHSAVPCWIFCGSRRLAQDSPIMNEIPVFRMNSTRNALSEGAHQNNFTISHLIITSSSAASQSRIPRRRIATPADSLNRARLNLTQF